MQRVLASPLPLTWDIFCKVVDNHGDLGVCWRLSAQLAARGHQVRLWVDDASALPWMAPGALQNRWHGIRVLPWQQPLEKSELEGLLPGDVWIEAFGCEIAPEFIEHFALTKRSIDKAPVWINLEYLSAESYVERMHRLPSPVMRGPAAGMTKWFFYPGFTPQTGGLLRETDLIPRRARFDRVAWLASQGIPWQGERLVSLFCYEPKALRQWLEQLAHDEAPTRLLVTPGRAAMAVRSALSEKSRIDSRIEASSLAISYLPYLPQDAYDELLWSCDLNFVRGEDSVVRALLAGKPFVWHIYPQDDDAHHAKLQAFMEWLNAPEDMRRFHNTWNGLDCSPLPSPDLPAWRASAQAAQERLFALGDLTTQLTHFVAEKR